MCSQVPGGLGQADLVSNFRDDTTSNMVVMLLRLITSAEIQSRHEFFLPFIMVRGCRGNGYELKVGNSGMGSGQREFWAEGETGGQVWTRQPLGPIPWGCIVKVPGLKKGPIY